MCGIGVFFFTKSQCSATIFAKSAGNVWNLGFLSSPINREIVWSRPEVCGIGPYIRDESPHNMGLSEFSFSGMLIPFTTETNSHLKTVNN